MKKTISVILSLCLLLSIGLPVLADGTTILTTTVPNATYTLNIPANQVITYGKQSTDIGNVTVTDSSGFADGKNLEVTVTYESFKCEGVSTTIPYYIQLSNGLTGSSKKSAELQSGGILTFTGSSSGICSENASRDNGQWIVDDMSVVISSEDWGKALAGEYSSTITFTSEVVAE